MTEKECSQFIWIGPLATNVSVRMLEISKRLVKEDICPIILTQKKERGTNFRFENLGRIPPSLKIYYSLSFDYNQKVNCYIKEFLLKICLLLEKIPPNLTSKVRNILKTHTNVKFIYATGPPFMTHIMGYLIKKKFNIPLIIEYTDPWSFNPYKEELNRLFENKIDYYLEKKILQFSDLIVSNSPYLNSLIKSNFPFIKNKQFVAIEDGLNIQQSTITPKENKQEITITYTGSIYGRRNIVPLLRILSELNKENFFKNKKVIIKIYGKYPKDKLERITIKLAISDLIFLGGFIKRTEVLNEIKKCDLALHIGESLDYPTIAFKVWDYISYGKKILFITREDTYRANFIKNNDLGIIIPINNLPKGKEIFKSLINNIIQEKFYLNIDQNKLKTFTWDNRALTFIKKITDKF